MNVKATAIGAITALGGFGLVLLTHNQVDNDLSVVAPAIWLMGFGIALYGFASKPGRPSRGRSKAEPIMQPLRWTRFSFDKP